MPDDTSPTAPAPRAFRVPDWAPPFDDAPPHDDAPPDDALPREGPLPPAADSDQDPEGENGAVRRLLSLSAPDPWPSQFAQALAEALGGTRPAGQLLPWTTVQARKRISQLGPMLATSARPRLRRVIANSPADGVLELAIVASYGSRVRAVAVRLERARPAARWYCTAIEAA